MSREFGEALQTERLKRGMSVSELSELSGVDDRQIQRLERGETKGVWGRTLRKLYKALEKKPVLFGEAKTLPALMPQEKKTTRKRKTAKSG